MENINLHTFVTVGGNSMVEALTDTALALEAGRQRQELNDFMTTMCYLDDKDMQ